MHPTLSDIIAEHAAAEAECNRLCAIFKADHAAWKRSKTDARAFAMRQSGEAHIAAAERCRELSEKIERAETVARRLVLLAPRRANRAAQLDLFVG